MAIIGVLKPVYAKITAEAENAAITYGTGKALGHAMKIDVSYATNDAKLNADGTTQESENGVTGAELTFGVDDITDEDKVDLLGHEKSGTEGNAEYELTDASAPYVGAGYIEVRKKKGVTTYVGHWYHKVQFKQPDASLSTKGEKLEFQTPTIKGAVLGVFIDNTGRTRFQKYHECATLDAATTWLNAKANISSGSGS